MPCSRPLSTQPRPVERAAGNRLAEVGAITCIEAETRITASAKPGQLTRIPATCPALPNDSKDTLSSPNRPVHTSGSAVLAQLAEMAISLRGRTLSSRKDGRLRAAR